MATSPRSNEGLFSRLKRGKSKQTLNDTPLASRISDGERSLDITPTKSPNNSKLAPSLALPLSFSNASQSNLREDSGISRYLSTQPEPTPTKQEPKPVKQIDDDAEEPVTKPGTSYDEAVADAIDGMERTSSKSKESAAIGTLQSRVILEMKEKEQLMGRFEALSRVHMALQEEVEKERNRAERAEALAKKKGGSTKVDREVETGVAGAAAGAFAGAGVTKEADEKAAREREQLENDKASFANERHDHQRQMADLDSQRAALEQERNKMELERSQMARQRDEHTALLNERQTEKDANASRQNEYESTRAKDREAHTSQLRDMESQLSASNASVNTSNAALARLQEQHEQLKASAAQNSQGPAQITDTEVAEEMSRLSQDVQNWVTNNFKKSRIDFEKLEKAGDSKELKQIKKAVPRYREAAEKAKLPFLQALVSARLMDEVWEDEFYPGMPGLIEEHETKEETTRGGLGYLREAFKVLSGSPSQEFHSWRASTVALLRRTQDPYLTAHTNRLISRVAFSINNLLSSITSASAETPGAAVGSSPLPSRVRDLQAFISKTIDIARLFRAQKVEYQFSLPGSVESTDGLIRTVAFESDKMVDVLDEEGALEDKTVAAAAWPLVMKLENNGRSRSVVFKTRVVCEPAK